MNKINVSIICYEKQILLKIKISGDMDIKCKIFMLLLTIYNSHNYFPDRKKLIRTC